LSFELQLERIGASRTGVLKVAADTTTGCHGGEQDVTAGRVWAIQDGQ
jgi:hypothetical protein